MNKTSAVGTSAKFMKDKLMLLTKDYSSILAILVMGTVFTLASPYFLTAQNLTNILLQCSALSIVAIGQALIVLSGNLDLSVGRIVENEYPKKAVTLGPAILDVKNLSQNQVFQNISFTLHQGEILGFSGLVGAGRSEVMLALLGLSGAVSGEVTLKGSLVKYQRFAQAIKAGFGLIPEDRKKQGLVQIDTVSENICMSSLNKVLRKGILNKKLERNFAKQYIHKLAIATPGPDEEVQYLSGGNQQKVVIAKWLMADSDIIIMDEPTRGIDVGAKSEIYRLMGELAEQGKSILMISSEMPELLGMCDNIIVMHEGCKVGELTREEASQEAIMALCV